METKDLYLKKWSDIKEGVDSAWQALNEAIKKARSHFD
jgi:hypothetical protein